MSAAGHTPKGSRMARIASAAIVALGLLALAESLRWRGAPFPGFFLMPNRVVPSAALPGWGGIAEGRPLYQQLVLAVDDAPVETGDEAYHRAAGHPVGEPVRYVFSGPHQIETRMLPLRRFGDREYLAIFGAYFVTGIAYALLALVVAGRWWESAMFRGLAVFGWVTAAFSFTGIDLYGPGVAFRLHALAEAMLPAAALHLALVCPRDRLARRPGVLALVYGLGLALAVIYQVFLYDPRAYTAIHNLCQSLSIVPILVFTGELAIALADPPPQLGTSGVRRLLAGAVAGVVTPAAVLAISGFSGGIVPVNVTAWVGYLFPLAALAAFRAHGGPLQSPPALAETV